MWYQPCALLTYTLADLAHKEHLFIFWFFGMNFFRRRARQTWNGLETW